MIHTITRWEVLVDGKIVFHIDNDSYAGVLDVLRHIHFGLVNSITIRKLENQQGYSNAYPNVPVTTR